MAAKRRSPWKMTIAAALVTAALAGGVGYGILGAGARETPAYETRPAARGEILSTITSSGTLQPISFVDVGAQVSGQLKKLHVAEGDWVKEGDLLAEIDGRVAQSRLLEAEATLDNLGAQFAAKQAEMNLAKQQQDRARKLLAQDAIAREEVDIAVSSYKVSEATLKALEAQIRQAEAALQTARTNLDYTRILAPRDGVVVSITAQEGQTLNANNTAPLILRISNLETMTVVSQVSEADVSRLKVGQDAYFTVLGQPDKRWEGKLRQVLPEPEILNNVIFYNALFDVPNPNGALMTQMTAQVFFIQEKAENVLTVPLSAVRAGRNGGREQIRVMLSDGTVEMRPVTLGQRDEINVVVLDGLKEGERVVVGGGTVAPSGAPAGGGSRMMGMMR